SHAVTSELLCDERVAVEVAGHIEREVTGHANAHPSHHRIQHVPVIVQEPFATRLDQTVVGIAARWLAVRHVGDEGAALLLAGRYTGNGLGTFQVSVIGLDHLLLADATGCREHWDTSLVRDPSYPGLVRVGALLQHGRLDAVDADDV